MEDLIERKYNICSKNKRYKHTRKYIINYILSCPKTKDNIYYCPNVLDMMFEEDDNGYYDIEYNLCRCFFKYKIFYTFEDILILKQEEPDESCDYESFLYLNKKFYKDHIDIINKNLKLTDYIDSYKNTLEELIDMFVIIYEYREKISN